MSIRRSLLVLSALLIALIGCSGGGATPAAAPATPAQDTSLANLSTRAFPKSTVTVTCLTPVTAGASLRVRIDVTGENRPVEVAARIGDVVDPDAAMTVASGSGPFEATLSVPAVITRDMRCWVRLTDADGATAESGFADFPLTGR